MNAYIVSSVDIDEPYVALIFAPNPEQARAIACRSAQFVEHDYIHVRAHRRAELDKDTNGNCREATPDEYRDAMFANDEAACTTCMLFDFGEPHHKICWHCGQCAECGCMLNCESPYNAGNQRRA